MSVSKEKLARGDWKDAEGRAFAFKLSQWSCPLPRQSVSTLFTDFNISTPHGFIILLCHYYSQGGFESTFSHSSTESI